MTKKIKHPSKERTALDRAYYDGQLPYAEYNRLTGRSDELLDRAVQDRAHAAFLYDDFVSAPTVRTPMRFHALATGEQVLKNVRGANGEPNSVVPYVVIGGLGFAGLIAGFFLWDKKLPSFANASNVRKLAPAPMPLPKVSPTAVYTPAPAPRPIIAAKPIATPYTPEPGPAPVPAPPAVDGSQFQSAPARVVFKPEPGPKSATDDESVINAKQGAFGALASAAANAGQANKPPAAPVASVPANYGSQFVSAGPEEEYDPNAMAQLEDDGGFTISGGLINPEDAFEGGFFGPEFEQG